MLVSIALQPGKTRQDLLDRVKGRSLSPEAWKLVREGTITEHGYKIGQRLGFVFVIESESEEAVKAAISNWPLVRDGWFKIEIDPMSPFTSDAS